MAYELKSIIPMGRAFAEYRDMFALGNAELGMRILGCGDGPASFNAEMTRMGRSVLSIDPLYGCAGADIGQRIDETFEESFAQVERNAEKFAWTRYPSLSAWKAERRKAMDAFLLDYDAGKAAGRYVEGGLPSLPFEDDSFDLALVSHFLFLYSAHLSEEFHVKGVLELLRVAQEVRIFPLVDLNAQRSPYVEAIMSALAAKGYEAEEAAVPYEVQKGATSCLIARRRRNA